MTSEDRAPPIGYFNFADSYWVAARQLSILNLRTTHADSPVTFLYHQAIELYLKSFLRLHHVKVKELIGHKTIPLSKRTAERGLSVDDEDIEVFELLDASNSVITARYLEVGHHRRASLEALERTCNSLRKSIAGHMRKAGVPIRALPPDGKISAKKANK